MADPKPRPGPVALISIYYFCAAAFVCILGLMARFYPEAHIDSRTDIRMVFYLATHHNLVPEPMIPFVMPILGVYLAAIGWGLWRLQKWARNLVVATSGLTVCLWLRAFLMRSWAAGESLFRDQLARQTVYILVLMNLLIFLCLTTYPDVAKAFRADE